MYCQVNHRRIFPGIKSSVQSEHWNQIMTRFYRYKSSWLAKNLGKTEMSDMFSKIHVNKKNNEITQSRTVDFYKNSYFLAFIIIKHFNPGPNITKLTQKYPRIFACIAVYLWCKGNIHKIPRDFFTTSLIGKPSEIQTLL